MLVSVEPSLEQTFYRCTAAPVIMYGSMRHRHMTIEYGHYTRAGPGCSRARVGHTGMASKNRTDGRLFVFYPADRVRSLILLQNII